jgi:hemopexin
MSGEAPSTRTPALQIDPTKPIQPLFQISPTLEENRSSDLRPVFISLGLDPSVFPKELGGEPDPSENRFAAPKAVFDTALRGSGRWSDRIWLFKGDSYFRYFEKPDAHDVVEGPFPLTPNWSGWPASFATGIDASLQGTAAFEGKAWFFKGNQYVRYDIPSDKIEFAPRNIAGAWRGMPDTFAQQIDAAVHGLGQHYGICWFFKGNQYVRYNLQTDMAEGDPRPIAGPWGSNGWPAAFSSIDFAFYGTGSNAEKIYFFHGDQYILYNLRNDQVEEGPKQIIHNWQHLAPLLPQPQLFLAEKYELRTFRGEMGSGGVIGTVNTNPRSKTTIYIATKRSATTTSESSTSILESQSQQTADTFSDAIKDDQSRSGSAEKYDYQLDASFHGEAGSTLTGYEADAKLNVRGGSQDVRNAFANSVGRQLSKQCTTTNETHKNSVRATSDSTTINTQTETSFEQTIDNTGNPEPINCAATYAGIHSRLKYG